MANKRQRKKRAKQRRQERAAAERARKLDIQKQERSRKYQQKQADTKKMVAISQPPKQRKTAKKTSNREWLEQAFIQRVDDANSYLTEFEENGTKQLLQDEYGGILADDKLMTAKGRFRKNPSKLSNKQLEQRISMLDSFLEDAPQYKEEKKKYDRIADKLGLNDPEMLEVFGEFMEFVRSILGERNEPSEVIKDITVARLNRGDTLEDLKKAFMDAYLHSFDYWDMVDNFSEHGVLI